MIATCGKAGCRRFAERRWHPAHPLCAPTGTFGTAVWWHDGDRLARPRQRQDATSFQGGKNATAADKTAARVSRASVGDLTDCKRWQIEFPTTGNSNE